MNKWIEWHGGKCPVLKGTLVDVRYRDGEEVFALRAAEDMMGRVRDAGREFWVKEDQANDIVAWRLHAPKVVAPQPTLNAPGLLEAAAKHMRDRAATYDKPEGERSMGATVAAFNAITGRDLTESEGWLLMGLLKMVRSQQRAEPHRDSIEDLVAYAALFGEARLGGR